MAMDPKSTYYDAGGIETYDVVCAKLTQEQLVGYLMGNIIKYACRLNHKGQPDRDAEKIAIYSQRLREVLNGLKGEDRQSDPVKDRVQLPPHPWIQVITPADVETECGTVCDVVQGGLR